MHGQTIDAEVPVRPLACPAAARTSAKAQSLSETHAEGSALPTRRRRILNPAGTRIQVAGSAARFRGPRIQSRLLTTVRVRLLQTGRRLLESGKQGHGRGRRFHVTHYDVS